MRLIFEPKIHLVAHTVLRPSGLREFLDGAGCDYWPDNDHSPDCLPEIAGRLCYMSYTNPRPGGNKAYLDHIKDMRHGSVAEHAVFSFIIEGVSRSLSHELVRHRAGMAYSQLSQRYVDESVAEYVVPPLLIDEVKFVVETHKQAYPGEEPENVGPAETEGMIGRVWLHGIRDAHKAYCLASDKIYETLAHISDKTARRKASRESARSLLPNATETKLYVTGNARAWRHFIEMRASRFADAEIRRLAIEILKVLQTESANLFGDYSIVKLKDGGEEAATPWRKV